MCAPLLHHLASIIGFCLLMELAPLLQTAFGLWHSMGCPSVFNCTFVGIKQIVHEVGCQQQQLPTLPSFLTDEMCMKLQTRACCIPIPTECPVGMYTAGMRCHICPDHTYKDVTGPQACTPCPQGTVAGSGDPNNRAVENHDAAGDCKPGGWRIERACRDVEWPAPVRRICCRCAAAPL